MSNKITVEIEVPEGYEFKKVETGQPVVFPGGVEVFSRAHFEEVKPAKGVIDLSRVIASGIDCEFSDKPVWTNAIIGRLVRRVSGEGYACDANLVWSHCRVRQFPHVHFWGGGYKRPLPEGLVVRVIFREYGLHHKTIITGQEPFKWQCVVGFKVLGVADGWRYEWEVE